MKKVFFRLKLKLKNLMKFFYISIIYLFLFEIYFKQVFILNFLQKMNCQEYYLIDKKIKLKKIFKRKF